MHEFIIHMSRRRLLLFTIEMTIAPRIDRRMRLFLHTLGLSCLGGAIFLQVLVFADIARVGRFTAVENNPGILTFEIMLTAFALIYFVYMYQRFIRSIR